MSPRRIDKARKATEIAQAALALFAERGYRATSVGRIAEAAGIAKGTLYAYYPTKEDLFIAAVRQWLSQFEDRLQARLAGLSNPVERLYAAARLHVDLYGNPDRGTLHLFLQILQQSLLPEGIMARRRQLLQEMAAGVTRTLAGILLEGVSQGVFRPAIARRAEAIAVNLHAFLDGIGLHSVATGCYFDLKAQIDLYLSQLLENISSPAGGEPAGAGPPQPQRSF